MNTSGTPIHAPGRPFHFMVAFWGERYRDYFVDLFLPSMLAPNNLPLLRARDGHRLYAACTNDDWRAIKDLPVMQRAARHAAPIRVELNGPPPDPPDVDAHARYAAVLRHMKSSFRMLLDAGYHPRAYGSFHAPDTLISDGMVASMLRSMRAGHHLLLSSALRQSEEGVIADLKESSLIQTGVRPSIAGREITIPPRMAADLAVRHLHPEMLVFEEGANGQPELPPFRYWRMPQGRGILLHTFFGLPVLMDFSVVPPDHTSCLDHDAFENVYISTNFRSGGVIRMVPDSDEFVVLSLTPEAVNYSAPVSPPGRQKSFVRREYERMCSIRRSMEFYALRRLDAVRRDLFRNPIRWHAGDIDEVWMHQEQRIEKLIDRAVGDYYQNGSSMQTQFAGPPNRNWRSFVLDVPVFEAPSILRRKVYRFLVKARDVTRSASTSRRG